MWTIFLLSGEDGSARVAVTARDLELSLIDSLIAAGVKLTERFSGEATGRLLGGRYVWSVYLGSGPGTEDTQCLVEFCSNPANLLPVRNAVALAHIARSELRTRNGAEWNPERELSLIQLTNYLNSEQPYLFTIPKRDGWSHKHLSRLRSTLRYGCCIETYGTYWNIKRSREAESLQKVLDCATEIKADKRSKLFMLDKSAWLPGEVERVAHETDTEVTADEYRYVLRRPVDSDSVAATVPDHVKRRAEYYNEQQPLFAQLREPTWSQERVNQLSLLLTYPHKVKKLPKMWVVYQELNSEGT